MKTNNKTNQSSIKTPVSTFVMYACACITGLVAIAALVNNVRLYNNSISQYVAQGYAKAQVVQQLLPAQLLPGIFEPVAVYGGIAIALVGVGIIIKKLSKSISLLTQKDETDCSVENQESVQTAEQQVITEIASDNNEQSNEA